MSGWITDAPRYSAFKIDAAVIESDGHHYPAIAFAFAVRDDEPQTALLLATPSTLKRLRADLDRAIEHASKRARIAQSESDRAAKALVVTSETE